MSYAAKARRGSNLQRTKIVHLHSMPACGELFLSSNSPVVSICKKILNIYDSVGWAIQLRKGVALTCREQRNVHLHSLLTCGELPGIIHAWNLKGLFTYLYLHVHLYDNCKS